MLIGKGRSVMRRLALTSKERTDLKKSATKKIRLDGELPATVYGRGASTSISVKVSDLSEILRTPGGRLSLIDLTIDGDTKEGLPVMIQATQRNPVTGKIVHVDFHRVSLLEAVHATVPISLVGEAAGVVFGGIQEQLLASLEIKALPDSIPSHIRVDVSQLGLGDKVCVSDLQIPEGVEVVAPSADSIVAAVHMPYLRAEDEPAKEEEAAAMEEPAKE